MRRLRPRDDQSPPDRPVEIFNTPSAPTEGQTIVMCKHAIRGCDIWKGGGSSQDVLAVTRPHHEIPDEAGYPDGVKGDQIPDLMRLVTICDIFGALIERQVYRPPMPASKAYAMAQGMMDRRDADLVRVFQPIVAAMA